MFQRRRILNETFVRKIVYRRRVGSTSDLAMELASDGNVTSPWLVLTDRQTSGRGRGSHSWWSGDGALTFSLILDALEVPLPKSSWALLSLATGLAVCRMLKARLQGVRVGLKWPNDVYLDWRKVSGILVEVPARRRGLLIVGIGINVNNSFVGAPPDVREKGVSLLEAAGCPHDLTDVLIDVVQRIESELALLARDPDSLAPRWSEHCLLRERVVRLELGSRQVEGTCKGIDRTGALVLETATGLSRFHTGVIADFE